MSKTWRNILIGLFVLFWIASAYIAYKKYPYQYEFSETIDAPADRIFVALNTPKYWKIWSPIEISNPKLTKTFSGPESGVGAKEEWSNNFGNKGSAEIIETDPPNGIIIRFFLHETNYEYQTDLVFTLVPEGSGTTVSVSTKGEMNFQLKILSFMIGDSIIKEEGPKALKELKGYSEADPKYLKMADEALKMKKDKELLNSK